MKWAGTGLAALQKRARGFKNIDAGGKQVGSSIHFLSQRLSFLLQIQVWDTAGQERFRTITQSYYRSAHGAILAYDLTRRSTFESIPHWIREIEKYGAANLVMMLIGRNLIINTMLCSFLNIIMKSLSLSHHYFICELWIKEEHSFN